MRVLWGWLPPDCPSSFRISGRLLLLILLQFTLYSPSLCFLDCYTNIEGPVHPVAEGSKPELRCDITERCVGTCDVNTVYFRHKGQEYRNLTIINDKTAVLNRNVSVEDYGTYICIVADSENINKDAGRSPCPYYLYVARLPLKPVLNGCKVTEWDKIVCDWLPSVADQDNYTKSPGTFNEKLEISLKNSDTPITNCTPAKPKMEPGTGYTEEQQEAHKQALKGPSWCNVSLDDPVLRNSGLGVDKREFCVRVIANNTLNILVKSEEVCYDLNRIVKPNTAVDLEMTRMNDSTVLLSWSDQQKSAENRSALSASLPLRYIVSYTDQWSPDNKTLYVVGTDSVILNVIPNTNYDWTVSVQPASNGFPSEPSQVQSFVSEPLVPCAGAKLIPGAFTLSTIADSDTRQVSVYWKPIEPRDFCGPDFNYIVRYALEDGTIDELITTEPTASFTLNSKGSSVSVGVANSQGTNERMWTQDLIIPDSEQDSAYDKMYLRVEGNDRNVFIDWVLPSTLDSSMVKSVTVFVCRSGTPRCRTGIDWWIVDSTAPQNLNLTLNESYEHLTFGMSLVVDVSESQRLSQGALERSRRETNNFVTGIKWAPCLYSHNGKTQEPVGVKVTTSNKYKHGELHVEWQRFECIEGYALVRKVIINYCRSSDPNNPAQSCDDAQLNDAVIVPAEPTFYRLTGLESGKRYRVWLQSVGVGQPSQSSYVYYVNTTETWASAGVLIGVVIVSLIVLAVLAAAFCCIYRRCEKCRTKFTAGLHIMIPDVNSKAMKTSSSSQAPMLDSTYSQQVMYNRQITRISNYSGGENEPTSQLDASQSSPLLSHRTRSTTPNGRVRNDSHNTTLTDRDDVFDDSVSRGRDSMPVTPCSSQQQPYIKSYHLNGFPHNKNFSTPLSVQLDHNHGPSGAPISCGSPICASSPRSKPMQASSGYVDHQDNNLLNYDLDTNPLNYMALPSNDVTILPQGYICSDQIGGGMNAGGGLVMRGGVNPSVGGYVSHDDGLLLSQAASPYVLSESLGGNHHDGPPGCVTAVVERAWDSSGSSGGAGCAAGVNLNNNSAYVGLDEATGMLTVNDLNGSFHRSEPSSGLGSMEQDAWVHHCDNSPHPTCPPPVYPHPTCPPPAYTHPSPAHGEPPDTRAGGYRRLDDQPHEKFMSPQKTSPRGNVDKLTKNSLDAEDFGCAGSTAQQHYVGDGVLVNRPSSQHNSPTKSVLPIASSPTRTIANSKANELGGQNNVRTVGDSLGSTSPTRGYQCNASRQAAGPVAARGELGGSGGYVEHNELMNGYEAASSV